MKNFQYTLGQFVRLFLLSFLMIGLGACTKDDQPNGQSEENKEASVVLSLDDVEIRDGDLYSGESIIKKVRLFVFREGDGVLVLDNQKLFVAGQDDFKNPFTISAHAGPRHIYVIANEPDALTPVLDKVIFKHQLDKIQMPEITASIVQPFVMTGATESPVVLNPDISVTATVSLTRIVAKITLDIKANLEESADLKITGVKILRNTKESTLLPPLSGISKKPFWTWQKDYDVVLNNGTDPIALIADNAPIYVYENLGSVADSADRATQLVVEALYSGIPTRYYAYINDQTSDAADHHYSLHRNHHYKLTGEITKIGEFSSLILSTNVLPWTVENLDFGFLLPHFVQINPETALDQENEMSMTTPFSITVKIKGIPDSKWEATLDNGLEFGFVGISEGNADGETAYTIEVKPLKAPGNQARRTNLFFTVNGKKVVLKKGSEQLTDIQIVQRAS